MGIRNGTAQKYILKIHSTRLRKEGWDLTLLLNEARRNGELISMADSQLLMWISEINGVLNSDEESRRIRGEIKTIRNIRGT